MGIRTWLGIVCLLQPWTAAAQELMSGVTVEEGPDEAPADDADTWEDVSGAPPPPARGKPVEPAREAPAFDDRFDDDGYGFREHALRPAPRGAAQPAMDGDLPRLREPEWPGEHLRDSQRFADAYSFPELFPVVGAAWRSSAADVGGDLDLTGRLELDLYLLRVGFNALRSVGGAREGAGAIDLDVRVPFALGDSVRVAILPGVSFPSSGERRTSENTNVRLQAIVGAAAGPLSAQVRGGVTEGLREAGLLAASETIDAPGALLGALVAARVVPAVELRAEAAADVNDERDRLTLLPGVALYPTGDERYELGFAAVIEGRGDDPGLSNADVGGLFRAGVNFY